MKLLQKLWNDEHGAINSIELILIGSVVLLGLIVGLAAYRDSLVNELADTARGIEALNQSYSYSADLDPDTGGFQNNVTKQFGDQNNDGNNAADAQVSVAVSICDAAGPSIGGSNFVDQPDAGEPVTITYVDAAGADENTPLP